MPSASCSCGAILSRGSCGSYAIRCKCLCIGPIRASSAVAGRMHPRTSASASGRIDPVQRITRVTPRELLVRLGPVGQLVHPAAPVIVEPASPSFRLALHLSQLVRGPGQ